MTPPPNPAFEGTGQRERCLLFIQEPVSQPVSRQNHPPISNPPRVNNVSDGKYWRGCDHRAVHIHTPRNPDPSTVTVSNLPRNLETLFGPRLKVTARKFGELAPLELLVG
jgi:hypothetical protein